MVCDFLIDRWWMDGWIDGWMDGWIEGWEEGLRTCQLMSCAGALISHVLQWMQLIGRQSASAA